MAVANTEKSFMRVVLSIWLIAALIGFIIWMSGWFPVVMIALGGILGAAAVNAQRNRQVGLHFPVIAVLLLFASMAVVDFLHLGIRNGFDAVIFEKLRFVSKKGTIRLSNGDLVDSGEAFLNFLASCVLWLGGSVLLLMRGAPLHERGADPSGNAKT